ncbi:MAG TPA: DNA repair protein RecO [Armatimonadota bacterium]|jgi:DNA repair protein RecO (recombination protein O)
MPSPRVYRANAIVLRRINLAETDKIVTFLTRELGKVSAVAKGSRRPASRLAGATELFGYCRVLFAVGLHLDVVTQVDVREAFPGIRSSLHKIAAASYMAELTDHLTEERHPNAEVFDLLLAGLYVLSALEEPDLVVTAFTLHMMAVSGYTPSLDVCARCHGEGKAFAAFSPTMGGVVCGDCRTAARDAFTVSADAIDAARKMLASEMPRASRIEMTTQARVHLLRMVRTFLAYHTDRPLKSARFLDELLAAKALSDAGM